MPVLKALVPIDGSKTSERAVRHVIALAKGRDPVEVHLVNVQEGADAWALKRFRKDEDIKRAQIEHGEGQLRAATRLLERAGVAHETHVLIGDPAEKIAQLAKRGGFDQIVMATHGRTGVAAMLMGSVASKILHHSPVPVTLVK